MQLLYLLLTDKVVTAQLFACSGTLVYAHQSQEPVGMTVLTLATQSKEDMLNQLQCIPTSFIFTYYSNATNYNIDVSSN